MNKKKQTSPAEWPNYILDEKGNPVAEPDILKWARWVEDDARNGTQKRRVGYDELSKYHISTVFLGMDYNFSGKEKPVLWETMVFENKVSESDINGKPFGFHKPLEQFSARYTSRKDAEKGHAKTVEAVRALEEEENRHEKE